MCAASAKLDKKKAYAIANEYVRRFIRDPRRKLLKRGMLLRI